MHPGEVAFGDDLPRRLVDSQLPEWSELPLERIGDHLVTLVQGTRA